MRAGPPPDALNPRQIVAAAEEPPTFFEGFREDVISVPSGHIFCRIGGSGPPLLLLHGYPQTSAMWHRIAPALAQEYTVVAADLRGYGRSFKPAPSADHAAMSKRAMAADMRAVMHHLGFERFAIGAHDRGARVAHRLAADAPGQVTALATLDIAPTREMYAHTTTGFARAYWHWYFLIQPAPFPERMIGADPDWFWVQKCCSGSAGAAPFARPALQEYLDAFRGPDVIAASCEDYRAAATIDIAHDDADPSLLQMPLLALWGDQGAVGAHFDVLALWRRRAANVAGRPIAGGHYLAEECPEKVLSHWRPFLRQHLSANR